MKKASAADGKKTALANPTSCAFHQERLTLFKRDEAKILGLQLPVVKFQECAIVEC
jgi:hypothetical protein